MLAYFRGRFKEVKLWNRTTEKATKLQEELKALRPKLLITVADTAQNCVRNADIIVTATNASSPLIDFADLKQHVHINAIGAGTNHYSELAMDIYENSQVFIESKIGAQTELKGLSSFIKGELGEVINGKISTESLPNKTVFQSMGNALEDAVVAALISEKYSRMHL